MSTNLTARLSNPKVITRGSKEIQSNSGLLKKEEGRKSTVFSKSQRLECRMKSKLGGIIKPSITNENDKNSGNLTGLSMNLNKEFFTKKEGRKNSCHGNGVIVEIPLDENYASTCRNRASTLTMGNNSLNSVNSQKKEKISQISQISQISTQNNLPTTTVATEPSLNMNINDLNVTMKSSKDDSAIKEHEGDKIFREQVLGGVINNQVENNNMPVEENLNLNQNLNIQKEKKEKSINIKNTIKSININLPSGGNSQNTQNTQNLNSSRTPTKTASSLNLENLTINKSHIPKFTTEEYRHMFSKLLRKDYSKAILTNLFEEEESLDDCLSHHKVTERMRCRMVDWMIEVLTNYKCDDYAFFYAVGIMDKFFKQNENVKVLQPGDLHLVGVTAMFMASKYQDIYPLRLKVVHEKIAHKKLAQEDIKKKEEEISRSLSYIIGKPTQWEFINHFIEEIFYTSYNSYHIKDQSLINTYLPSVNNTFSEKEKEALTLFTKLYTTNMINLLRHVTVYLAKMNCHDYSLCNKKPSLVASSTIYVALKICEQINKEEYVNEYFTRRLVDISKKNENDIIKCAQKILYNAQNFDTIFTGLENLKRVHFNAIIELKCTK
jgi:G2/mitotic-specific cyclin-B, other